MALSGRDKNGSCLGKACNDIRVVMAWTNSLDDRKARLCLIKSHSLTSFVPVSKINVSFPNCRHRNVSTSLNLFFLFSARTRNAGRCRSSPKCRTRVDFVYAYLLKVIPLCKTTTTTRPIREKVKIGHAPCHFNRRVHKIKMNSVLFLAIEAARILCSTFSADFIFRLLTPVLWF